MTAWSEEIVGRNTELFPSSIGELLARMVRNRWPRDTAKHVVRVWELDPKTAKGLIEGHASERTITKALKAEGWELLDKLGEAVTGQSYADWQEQKLNRMMEEAELVQANVTRLRDRQKLLDERAADQPRVDAGERDPVRGVR